MKSMYDKEEMLISTHIQQRGNVNLSIRTGRMGKRRCMGTKTLHLINPNTLAISMFAHLSTPCIISGCEIGYLNIPDTFEHTDKRK